MTDAIMILLFWVVLILIVWLVLRSRRFRDARENIQAMQDAPENSHTKREFHAHMANPMHQLSTDQDRPEREKKAPHGD
jgi:predicted secreted protein